MNNFKKIKRGYKLSEVLIKYGLEDFFDRSGIERFFPDDVVKKSTTLENIRSRSMYERIRLALEELGPAYVKLGQMLSNRSDILPQGLISELQKLQDKVEVQLIDVKEKLGRELGIAPDMYFSFIEPEPMASASIGQVFRATLKDGQDVVLKIKREGIDQIIESDLLIIKDLGLYLENKEEIFKRINLTHLLEAFENSLRKEISLDNELRNIERFANNFKSEERIYIPQVYKELSNNEVLCMDFVEGIKVSNKVELIRVGFAPDEVAVLGLDLYMQQVLQHGFFHADPHPGNIFITPDGKMSFIDFGAMGTLLSQDRELIEDLVMYYVQKNTKKIIATIKEIALDFSVPDEKQLEREINELINMVNGNSLQNIDLKKIMERAMAVFSKNQITLPENFYLLIKGIGQIEGIGRYLNPNLDIFEVMQPYAQQIAIQRLSPKRLLTKGFVKFTETSADLLALPQEIRTFLRKIEKKEIRLKHEISGLSQMQKTFERLALAIILSSFFIGSSILALTNIPPKIYDIPVLSIIGFIISGGLGFYMIFKQK